MIIIISSAPIVCSFNYSVHVIEPRPVASAEAAGARAPAADVSAPSPRLVPQQHIVPQLDCAIIVNL